LLFIIAWIILGSVIDTLKLKVDCPHMEKALNPTNVLLSIIILLEFV
jgi:hypothetical protein